MLQYNTQKKKMALPEYGRSVQNMVDHAMTITDRAERQRCANAIITIMGNMFPSQQREGEDFEHKLWDHLAIMSDFKLDVDYPFEIMAKERMQKPPQRVPYEQSHIRFRHYGRLVEHLIQIACDMPDGDEKMNLLAMLCNQMKKDYITWNKDTIDNAKINQDLMELSRGRLSITPELATLMDRRVAQNFRTKGAQSRSNQGAPGNRNKKKF